MWIELNLYKSLDTNNLQDGILSEHICMDVKAS
jgi:hypothetical protein